MVSLANLCPGQVVAVFYDDDTYWHERLLVWRCNEEEWFVLTPDADLYPENLACNGGDGPSRLKVKGVDFRYWSRIGGASYRFAKPLENDDAFRAHVKQAYREGSGMDSFDPEWRPSHIQDVKGVMQAANDYLGTLLVTRRLTHKGPSLRAGGGLQVEVAAAGDGMDSVRPIVLPGPTQVWVITERMDGHALGESALVDPSKDLMIGSHTGLIKVASGWMKAELVETSEAPNFIESRRPPAASPSSPAVAAPASGDADDSSLDARALAVDYDQHNLRHKAWREVVHESREFGYPDWPHEGPTTVLHMLKHMQRFGGDPKQWLELWCRQKSIADQDRVKHELRCLMDALYYGGVYDQLNLPVLASFESIARRVQCIVDAYSTSSSSPDWSNAKLFTGYTAPEDLVMPQLKTWAARRGKEEVELFQARNRMKELRRPGAPADEAAQAVADGSAAGGARLNRRAAQRLCKRARIRDELRELIFTLNWMHTGDFNAQPGPLGHPPHGDVVKYLEAAVGRASNLGDLSCVPSQEAALRELLHGQDGYSELSTPASLAPFNLELISLPQDLDDAPRAEDLLSVEDRRYLEVQERMLRDTPRDEHSTLVKPYWDPALKNNPRTYRKFIQKLHSIKYLEYTLSPSQHAGVFFVWKSDRKRVRMIVDARPANDDFLDPPGISLATAETFSKFEVVGSGDDDDDNPFELYAGLSDVRDCFHRIKQPRWLSKFFCFMPIEARHVGLTGTTLEGQTLKSSDLIYPMPGSLCMGFSWSLFFAQRINEVVMSDVGTLSSSSLIHDRSGPAVFDSQDPGDVKHFVYVDNLGVFSSDRRVVEQGLDDLSKDFTDKRLLLHPGEVQHSCIKALGVELDGVSLSSHTSPARLHRVRQGLRCVLRRKRCTGRVLEILVGHCTYVGLLNRCSLSVFHSVYKFIKSHYNHSTPLWASVQAELRAFCGLLPLLKADWLRPWCEQVTVSDASEEGYGVCCSSWKSSAVAQVGRCPERERFKRLGPHSARESALTSAGFVKDEVSGQWADGLLDDGAYLEASGWCLNANFPEVPRDRLDSSQWKVVRQDPGESVNTLFTWRPGPW
eukprot:Skav223122  [mRNA]  locus=scaffold419:830256:833692:- [translate_table: standard]